MNQFAFGEFEISRIEEIVDLLDAKFLIPNVTTDVLDQNAHWLAPNHYNPETKQFVAFIQSWLIRTGDHTILVDACCGNHKSRPWYGNLHNLNTPYLDRLKAAGCTPEDVDFVLCTHLHPDHVGWNTRLENGEWVPTFPHAKYLISKKECDSALLLQKSEVPSAQTLFAVYEDSVLPVIAAGQMQYVDGPYEVTDSIVVEPAPGHTVGHCIVRAGRKEDVVLFTGDVLHSPIQIAYPEFNSGFCSDPVTAIETRRRILDECSVSGYLLVPAHFGPPHVGRISRRASRYSFRPGL
jgi:glyoxylase-like metal-dependent hydrolase (beta-lactamase superfamily II)